jgi:fatty acid desaturase
MSDPAPPAPAVTLTVEPPLRQFTAAVRKPLSIEWYRTPLPPGVLKRLHARSDFVGAGQTLGYLACLAVPAAVAIRGGLRGEWVWAAGGLFTYGIVASFLINAVHELGHNTVFRSAWLNTWFCRLFALLGWINYELFGVSHVRHHRYTLHPPDDDENPLPIRFTVRDFIRGFLFNYRFLVFSVQKTVRLARGRFEGQWEQTLYPADRPELARPAIRWSRFVLAGHLAVLAVSVAMGWWIVPLVVSTGCFFGNGLFLLCNNTQHIALPSHNTDFRLCCRTFTLNPVVRLLYWHMNYHTEHHMYAAVPCYRLGALHRLVRHDLPPTPHGIVAVWREIAAIKRREAAEPGWVYMPPLPSPAAPPDGI